MSDNPIVIYDNDPDGICSAWCFKEKWGEKGVTFVRASHQDPIPKGIDGRDVYMVDVCFETVEEILEVCERAKRLIVIDHHETTYDLAKKVGEIENLAFFTDEHEDNDHKKSACRLTWEWFNGPSFVRSEVHDIAPMVVKYVEDFDLWRFKLPLSREVHASYSSYPIKLKDWDHVANLTWDQAVDEGSAILRYQNKTVDELLRNAYLVYVAGTLVPCVNVAVRSLVSEVGHRLCKKFTDSDFAITFYRRPDGKYKYSFRSEGEFSVKEVAEKFKGGGHRNAAGALLDKEPVKVEDIEPQYINVE